ncbi:MAG: ABC transporter ATP-binding protein [Deltaproteobacteria bacterium]|jgi:ATP-binding cassette, subfamily B, bacterial|nr:ABC transporter ATP-binding protein [Deltaproteobacteria bacterium]MBT4527264.1 ABC transporter ATP-binding protein [Deltaproteobacteria bacterium]
MNQLLDGNKSKKQLEPAIWRELFTRYILPYQKLFLFLLFVAGLVAASEAGFTLVTRHIFDVLTSQHQEADLWIPGFIYLALMIMLVIGVRGFIYLAGKISTRMMYDIRNDMFVHLQKLSFSFYDKHPVGWLMARMTSDCMRLANILAWGALDLFWGIPFLMGIVIVLFVLNWQLALIVLTVVPVLLVISLYFKRIILKSARKVRKTNSRITAAFNEGINGVYTSKVLVREKQNLKEFTVMTKQMFDVSVKNELQIAVYLPLILAIGSVATGLSLWFGGVKVLAGILTLGTMVAFIKYSSSFFDPVLEIARVLTELQTAQASAERILGLINTSPEIHDSKAVTENLDSESPSEVIKNICFKTVSFSYGKDEKVLDQFNLNVEAGQTIALVGATGGGKSTIVNLLCRFYEPTSGEILINGIDYRKRSLIWLQSNLGIVLQTPHLFSGNIIDNIRYGNLNATEKEVTEASNKACAHNFINRMPDGYHTEIGEGGINLSTGQKQLISLARAMLADPQIFIMDEATSAVDTNTEHLIQNGLENILNERICFIIAHRLSTIRSADLILLISDGSIMESGTHSQLIARSGRYYSLYQKQFAFDNEKKLKQTSYKTAG